MFDQFLRNSAVVVSMLQVIFELPDVSSIKEKRQIVASVKDRIRHKFRVSIAEVDLSESLRFCHLGMAHVSNDKRLGEAVMTKIEHFLEEQIPGRLHDSSIHSEIF